MKKLYAIILFAAMIVLATAGLGVSYLRSMQDNGEFLVGTEINGRNVTGRTPAEAAELLSEGALDEDVILLENNKEVFRMPVTELGYQVNTQKLEKALTECMESEKENHQSVIDALMNGNRFNVELSFTVNTDVFKKAVTLDALTAPRRENEDAKILYNDEKKKCEIEPEVQGTLLKEEDLQKWLRSEIDTILVEKQKENASEHAESAGAAAAPSEAGGADTGKTGDAGQAADGNDAAAASAEDGTADPANENKGSEGIAESEEEAAEPPMEDGEDQIVRTIPASMYIPPDKKASDEDMQKKLELLNSVAGETITYTFGSETQTLDFKTIFKWLKIRDGQLKVREEKVTEYVHELAQKYETRYRDRVFNTSLGTQVTIPATLNEYGYTILEDQEAAQLTQEILAGEDVTREPVYMYYGPWGDPLYLGRNGVDDLAGTYVEVSLSTQHMWYYVNGQLIVESDVVTGDTVQHMETQTGAFPLAFKESPATLRGGEGKKKYTTKVQYWMPFYEGQGLHDAWWKTVFGGTEYQGNGSHGCVNLPPSVAETVYNNIVPGTAIIIYN